MTDDLFLALQRRANEQFGGHVTIMKFSGNWRVWFGTPNDRGDITAAPDGRTFEEAATKALACDVEYFKSRYGFCAFCAVKLTEFEKYACANCRQGQQTKQASG
jgi:hypothetical protein